MLRVLIQDQKVFYLYCSVSFELVTSTANQVTSPGIALSIF